MKRKTEVTDEDPSSWAIRRLKTFLSENGVNTDAMTEKNELVDSARLVISTTRQKVSASEAELRSSPLGGSDAMPARELRSTDQWAKVKLFNPTLCPEYAKEIAYLRKNATTIIAVSSTSSEATSGPLLDTIFRILVLNRSFDTKVEPLGYRYIHQVAIGDDNGKALSKAVASKGGDQKICGRSLKRSEMVFRCLECAADPTCIMCADCFNNSPCVNHEYKMATSGGGMCDCGDPTAWKSTSFCCKHRGASAEDDPTVDMPPAEKAWVSAVLRGVCLQSITIIRRMAQGNMPAESPIVEALAQCLVMLTRVASSGEMALRLVFLAASEELSLEPPLSDASASTALPRPKINSNASNNDNDSASAATVIDRYGKTSLLEELSREDALGMRNRFKGTWAHVAPFVKLLVTDMSSKLLILRALIKYEEPTLRPDYDTIENSRTRDDIMKNLLSSEAVQVMTVPWAAEASLYPSKLRLGPHTTSVHRILSGLLYGLSALHKNTAYPNLPSPFIASSGPTAIMKYSKDVPTYKIILLSPFHNLRYLFIAAPVAARLFASSEVLLRSYFTILLSAHFSDIIRREEEGSGQHNYFAWDLHLGIASLQRQFFKSVSAIMKSLPTDTIATFKALTNDVANSLRLSGKEIASLSDSEISSLFINEQKDTEGRASSVAPLHSLDEILPEELRKITSDTRSFPAPPSDSVTTPDPLFQSQLDKCESRLQYPILNCQRSTAAMKTKPSGLLPYHSRIEYAKALVAVIGAFLNEASTCNAMVIAPSNKAVLERRIEGLTAPTVAKIMHFCGVRSKHATTFVIPLIRTLASTVRTFLSSEVSFPSAFLSNNANLKLTERRAFLLERLLAVCPPFADQSIVHRQVATPTSPTTDSTGATVPSVSVHDWIDMPVKAMVLSHQVADELWKRNYFEVERQTAIYNEFQTASIIELDLFTLQYMTAVVGPHNMAAQLLTRFSYIPQDDRHELKMSPLGYPRFLDLILTLVGDDNQSSCNKQRANMNRILRFMAPQGPIVHSKLMESINRDAEDEDEEAESQENAKALQELIVTATTSEQQRKGTTRRLKNDPAMWAGISIYNSEWDINDRKSALDEYNILFKKGQSNNASAPNQQQQQPSTEEFPRAIVGKHHEALVDPIRSLLHSTPTVSTALYAVLNKAAEIQEQIAIAERIASGGAPPATDEKEPSVKSRVEGIAEGISAYLRVMRNQQGGAEGTNNDDAAESSDDYEFEEDEERPFEEMEEGEREGEDDDNSTIEASDMGTPAASQPRSESKAKKSVSPSVTPSQATTATTSEKAPVLPPFKFVKVSDTYFLTAIDLLLLTMEDAVAIAKEEKKQGGEGNVFVGSAIDGQEDNGVTDFGYFESWHQRVITQNPYNKGPHSQFNCDFYLPLPEMAGRSPFLHSLAKMNFKHAKLLTPKNIIPTASTLQKINHHSKPLHVCQQQEEPQTAAFKDGGLSLESSLPVLVKYLSMELENQLKIKTTIDKAVADVYLAKVRKLAMLIANEPKIAKTADNDDDNANDAEAKANAERDAKAAADRAARIKEKQQLLLDRMKKKQEKASAAHNIGEQQQPTATAISNETGKAATEAVLPNTHETLMMKATEVECCFCRLADDDGRELMWLAHAAASGNVAQLKKQRGKSWFAKPFLVPNPTAEELKNLKSAKKGASEGAVASSATTAFGTAARNDRGHAIRERAQRHAHQRDSDSDYDDDDFTDTDDSDLGNHSDGGSSSHTGSHHQSSHQNEDCDNYNEDVDGEPSTRFTISSNLQPKCSRLSVSVMTCGHAAHLACIEKHHAYVNQQRGRQIMDLLMARRGFRGMEYLGGAELCCPICAKIASVLCCMPKMTQQNQPGASMSDSSTRDSGIVGPSTTPGCFSEWVGASIASANQTRAFKAIVSECSTGLSRSVDHPPIDEKRTDAWTRILNMSALEVLLSEKSRTTVKPFAADYVTNLFNYGLTMSDNITLLLEGRIKLSQEHGASGASAATEIPLPHIANLATLMTTSAVSIFDDDGSAFTDPVGKQKADRNAFKANDQLVALFAKILDVVTQKKSLTQVAADYDEIKKARASEEIQNQLRIREQNELSRGSNERASSEEPKTPVSHPWWFVTGAIGSVVGATKAAISKTIGAAVGNTSASLAPATSTVGMDFKFDLEKDVQLAGISLPSLDLIELYGLMCSFHFAAAAESAKIFVAADKSLLSSAATSFTEAAVSELVNEQTFAPFVAAIVARVASEADPVTVVSSLWHYLVQLSLFKHILTGTLPAPLPVGEPHHSHSQKHSEDSAAKSSVPYGAYLLPLRSHADAAHTIQLFSSKVEALAKHLCPSISIEASRPRSLDELVSGLRNLSNTVASPPTGSIAAVAASFVLQQPATAVNIQQRPISIKPIHGELSVEESTKARCNDFAYLPPNYHAYIHTATTLQNCSACGASNCAMMCLKCRALICLRAKPKPEAVFHSQTCGCGVGLFLLLKGSAYVVVSGVAERATQNNPVYVDKFGEFDNGLRRGVALTLSKYVASDLLVPLITNTWDHDTNSLKNAFRNSVATL